MEIELDEDSDAAFVWLTERPSDHAGVIAREVWPEELRGKIGLLFDDGNKLIGLEVLEASVHLPRSALQR